jgi:hypothetical protein
VAAMDAENMVREHMKQISDYVSITQAPRTHDSLQRAVETWNAIETSFRTALAARPADGVAVPAGWKSINTAPKDGTEFLVRYTLQNNVKRLIHWNTLRGHWADKGEAVIGLEMQKAEWTPLPSDTAVVPHDFSADQANRLYGEAYGVDWVYASTPATPEQPKVSESRPVLYSDEYAAAVPTVEAGQGERAAEWVRNNYQDYATIADLCDALRAALSSPAPVQQEQDK